jgi:uncharacterized membrane protein
MNPPNAFAALARRLESGSSAPLAAALLAAAVAGFWLHTGSFFAALALTLLGLVPLALAAGAALIAAWVILRLCDGLTRLLVRFRGRSARPRVRTR